MKLITEVSGITELNSLRILFEGNGVLIHVGNEDTARNYTAFHPAGKYAIFSLLENQFRDAKMLMSDENHVVEFPVNIDDYKSHIERNKYNVLEQIRDNILLVGISALILVFGVAWILYA